MNTRTVMVTGAGLDAALQDVHTVIHAGSDSRSPELVDVEGTRRLVEHARRHGVTHVGPERARLAAAFCAGRHAAPGGDGGQRTWAEWLHGTTTGVPA